MRLRIAIATERSGLEFYTRAPRPHEGCARPDGVPEARRQRKESTSGTLEKRYRELIERGSAARSRGRRSCSSRAPRTVCSTTGAEKLRKGVNDQQALLIGIKCERGSHKFFKRYGERFEDSEGKQNLPRVRRRRARAPRTADPRIPARCASARAVARRETPRRARSAQLIDLHTHTTASDGRCAPAELVARAAAAGVTVLSVTDHDTVAGCAAAAAACAGAGIELRARHRDHRGSSTARTSTCSATSSTPHRRRFSRFLPSSAAIASIASAQMVERLAPHGIALDADAILRPGVDDSGKSPRAGRGSRARWWPAGHVADDRRGVRSLARARPAGVRPARRRAPLKTCSRGSTRRAASRRSRTRVLVGRDEWIPGFAAAGLDALEAYHSEHDAWTTRRYLAMAGRLGLPSPAGPTITATRRTVPRRRAACRCLARSSIDWRG